MPISRIGTIVFATQNKSWWTPMLKHYINVHIRYDKNTPRYITGHERDNNECLK